MKKLFYSYILFSVCLFGIAQSDVKNAIVVKVGNEVITNYDVKSKILSTLLIANLEINQNNIDRLKSQSLENLINLRIKQIHLEKYDLKIDKRRVNMYLRQLSSKNQSDLINEFNLYKLDYSHLNDEAETELKWQQFIYNKFSNKIEISDQSISNEINKILESKSKIKEFNLSEIEVFYDNNSKDNKISETLEEINKIGFEKAASTLSIASTSSKKGSLGWINSNALSKNIGEIVRNLKPGEISDPIIRANSILFLKLNEERLAANDNIDTQNLKMNLIKQKKNEIFSLYSNSFLSKLRNDYLIEYING